MSQSDTNNFLCFAGRSQTLAEGAEVRIMTADASSHYVENFPDGASSPTYAAFAFPLTAIASQRGQAGKFGNPLVGQRADLRHLRHQPGHRTVGNPFDGAKDT